MQTQFNMIILNPKDVCIIYFCFYAAYDVIISFLFEGHDFLRLSSPLYVSISIYFYFMINKCEGMVVYKS